MRKTLRVAVMILASLVLSPPSVQAMDPSSRNAEVRTTVFADSNPPWIPQWAKRAVWYQIFPERFRNGDPENDPKVLDQKGSWPHDQASPWEVHPWTSDWYEMQSYEKKNGKDIWFNIQRRRYGGDIQGIIDKLDYLKDLGVNAIYLNPIFWSPSSHKYDAILYHHIDPTFGPDPEGDKILIAKEDPANPSTWTWTTADKLVLRFLKEAHSRGMKVIFDGVFNHVGIRSPYFRDVEEKQETSKYKDWFIIKSFNHPEKGEKFEYQGWWNVRELPVWRKVDQDIASGPKQYIFQVTRRWMDPEGTGRTEHGIDGWRLDAALCVGHTFWKEWSRLVTSINPDAFMVGEIIDTMEVNKPFLKGDEFAGMMNYHFAFTCAEFFFQGEKGISPAEFETRLKEVRDAYAPSVAYAMQNLIGSHDTSRMATMIVNRNVPVYRDWRIYYDTSKANTLRHLNRKPTNSELDAQKLFALFQMTYVGAPMIYYGDEAGMWGANDPCCRKPMVWEDLAYVDETFNPDGTKRKFPDSVAFNRGLFEHYKEVINIRREHQALQVGDYTALPVDGGKRIFAFQRTWKDECLVVVMNTSGSEEIAALKLPQGGSYRDLLNDGAAWKTLGNGRMALLIKPWSGAILLKTHISPHGVGQRTEGN
ncbi:MAG: glycoside hydrolase family 13 protein [Candidatus Ozemobacteraceae bacterium]